ncbi:MAG: VTT domain-containing protein [Caulobacteraceae bacterium]|nr:VTT domain-containing protein [Caulobacteraceae bacterium]
MSAGAARTVVLISLARRFGPLLIVAILVALAFASGLTRHLSLHELRERRLTLLALVHAHPILSVAAYMGLYALFVALSLPIALVMTLTGGLLFGAWIGGVAAAVACTLGSGVIFIICRTAVGEALRGGAGSMIARIEAGVRRDAFAYVVALRLIPVAPFWLANLALGFVDIPLRTFLLATLIGLLPVSLIYAGLGASLNHIFASGQRVNLHALLHPSLVIPLIALGFLALAPIGARYLRRRAA